MQHLVDHEKRHAHTASVSSVLLQCGVSGHIASRSDNLRTHMLLHARNERKLGELSSDCPQCGKKILDGGMLRHLRVHRDVHVQCCCGKPIKKKGLAKHQRICEKFSKALGS